MINLLRLGFGAWMVWAVLGAIELSHGTGLTRASMGLVGVSALELMLLGIANAVLWTPVIGRAIAEPVAGNFTRSSPSWERSRIYKTIMRLERQKRHLMASWVAWFTGIFKPMEPEVFYVGLQNARPGSYLQRHFARKVYGFMNARRCLEAFSILKSLGCEPPKHREQSINSIILAFDKPGSNPVEKVFVPNLPPPTELVRNPRISLPRKFNKSSALQSAETDMGR